MPADPKVLEQRRMAILSILREDDLPIEQQADLVERLRAKGFQATQSSVSRDLQALGVIRVKGHYELPEWSQEGYESPFDAVVSMVQRVKPVPPCHILLVTRPGAGELVANGLRESYWPSVLGMLADANSVLLLADNHVEQRVTYERLKRYSKDEPSE